MSDKIFIDTNILVYAHDVSAGAKHTTAKQRILELWEHKSGCLSIQVLQEFYVTVTQKVPHPMDHATALEVVRSLRYWNVHEPSVDDIINATDIQQRSQVSFWDAMILQSAIQLECDFLWSEDLNPGQVYQGIKLINPLR